MYNEISIARGIKVLILDACFTGAFMDNGLFSTKDTVLLCSTSAKGYTLSGGSSSNGFMAFGRGLVRAQGWNMMTNQPFSNNRFDLNHDKKISLREMYYAGVESVDEYQTEGTQRPQFMASPQNANITILELPTLN